ncbi:MAG: leucyl aminopeptidase [Alphaproteobacteria bacterium]|nr:leucyl aminopeptidase [Alphaproteobacteria bacterium]
MKISFVPSAMPAQGTFVLTVADGCKLGPLGAKFDHKLGGAMRRAMSASSFKGEKGQTLAILAPSRTRLKRLVLVGIGEPDAAKETAFQHIGGAIVAALQGRGDAKAVLLIDEHKGLGLEAAEAAAQAAFGARLRSYRFDKYRTKLKPDQKPALKTLAVACKDMAAARSAYAPVDKLADAVFLARDLVSEPPNILYPETFAEQCKALKDKGLKVDILDEKQLKKLGMNALLGVAQGSVHPARLVTLSWLGDPGAKDKRPVVFVGKGVTFDTGGISLKTPGGMEEMKEDMAGAAAVAGALVALAARKAKANVVGIIGLVENMPSATAQRPGDIVASMSGQTIEIINTDAEGRLVLCDAIWYAQETFKPRCVVDLATLTGAIVIALGHEYAGLFANDDILAKHLCEAGEAVGENLWRFPLHEAFDKALNSSFADMKNVSGNRDAGSISGAQFIKRFVKRGVLWAHLDIAGMAMHSKDRPICPKGATAFGVRLLERFVKDYVESKQLSA